MRALARAYFTAGEYHKSLKYYLLLENTFPDDTQVLYQIAMCQGKLNRAGESHFYFGSYFKKEKKGKCTFHLRKALPYYPAGSNREATPRPSENLPQTDPEKLKSAGRKEKQLIT